MLVIDISINRQKFIETIMINRLEELEDKDAVYTYRIVEPEGFEKRLIKHKYSEGYMPLLIKALDIISKEK